MLSLILLCRAGPDGAAFSETVVRTLSPLVAASARGLLRDVVLVGAPGLDLPLIAEHAGCAVVEATDEGEGLQRAFGLARSNIIIVFYAGYVPEAGFFEEIEDYLNVRSGSSDARRLRAAPEKFFERMFPQIANSVGVIAGRDFFQKPSMTSFASLVAARGARADLRRKLRRIGVKA
jgi:hypothetical protein